MTNGEAFIFLYLILSSMSDDALFDLYTQTIPLAARQDPGAVTLLNSIYAELMLRDIEDIIGPL